MAKQEVEEIAEQMARTRRRTLALFDLTREEDLHESPGFGFRPIIWHLAHIGVFESYWLLQKLKNEAAPDERYERIFDPINTPREQSKNLPTRREMEDYLTRVRERTLHYLDETEFSESEPLLRDGYIFRLVLEHEQQHQETLAYLFHLLNPSKKTRPVATATIDNSNRIASETSAQRLPARAGEMVSVAEGAFLMGAPDEFFAYDNERPAHSVHVPAFKIDKWLTTNEEYAHFINEGGYRRREWWTDEGWREREREDWNAPLYWTQQNGEWRVQGMFDESLMGAEQHPVTGVSWYEAEAYARFMKKRLPTEAEWEKAASWDDEREQKRRYSWGGDKPSPEVCNFDYHFWGTTPAGSFPEGASAYGCLDMTGNVWEWTSSPFAGYPNFEAYPYPEYSETWFDGDHRVLKGGSWATQASSLRISFRNFFRRQFRIAFAGIRCAGEEQ